MSLFLRRPPPPHLPTQRAFSTTTLRPAISLHAKPSELADTIPAYPYGPARWYKQSDSGLYGGQRIQFGHNVGTKIAVKTPRSFQINVHNKRIFSKALNAYVKLKVSARMLRTIDKVGGLDEYLLGETTSRIKGLGQTGWRLRWAVMQARSTRERFEEERRELGVEELEQQVKVLERRAEALRLAEAEASGEVVPVVEGDASRDTAADELYSKATAHSDLTEPVDAEDILVTPRKRKPILLQLGTHQAIELDEGGWSAPFFRPRMKPKSRKAKWSK